MLLTTIMTVFTLSIQTPEEPGIHERTLTLSDGSEMRYTLSIPEREDATKPVPLILALHYGWVGQGPPEPFYGKGILTRLIEPALGDLGAVIVDPDCPAKGWTDPKSDRLVMALLDHIMEQFPINTKEVLVTGYSLGGAGTWHMAALHPDRFSAAIPVAGWPASEHEALLEAMPLYVIHSRQDEVVPIGPGEAMVEKLRAGGKQVEFLVVEGLTHHQTPLFAPYLKQTVPWIKEIWGRN